MFFTLIFGDNFLLLILAYCVRDESCREKLASISPRGQKFLAQTDFCVHTRDVFYVRREVDLMKTAKVNAFIMRIFGKIELLSIHAT